MKECTDAERELLDAYLLHGTGSAEERMARIKTAAFAVFKERLSGGLREELIAARVEMKRASRRWDTAWKQLPKTDHDVLREVYEDLDLESDAVVG